MLGAPLMVRPTVMLRVGGEVTWLKAGASADALTNLFGQPARR